jgi:hypothetical protein
MISTVFVTLAVLTSVPAFAQISGTICYHESREYAKAVVASQNITIEKGKLEMLSSVAGVQLEGWSFPLSSGGVIVVIASADGDGSERCRVNSVYFK